MRKFYDQHSDLVFNLALSYLQNREDAEEVTQDVFVKIFRTREKFRGKADIQTWIYRITINTCLDYIKARNAQKRFARLTSLFRDDSDEPRYPLHHFDHPGIEMENREATERIFRLINQLPAKQKTALILSKIEGRSQKEISAIMKLNIKAVESLIQRAKSTLSKKINSENEGSQK